MRRSPLVLLTSAVLSAVAAAAAAAPGTSTRLGGCPVFPATSAWNRDVSHLAVDPRSDDYVRSIGLDAHLHPDFGTVYGIPFRVVPRTQRRVPIHVTDYPDESDKGPAPIPLDAPVEEGSDAHVIVLQRGTCRLTELYGARKLSPPARGWAAASVARWSTRSNALRHRGWTSADAAGLPILPGLARAAEVTGGRHAITHALRMTAPRTQKGYISPARHSAGSSTDPALPPMGAHFRLKASYDISTYSGQARIVLVALKKYGMILADNGSPWYITGAPDRHWSDADLHALNRIPGSAFEAVQAGPVLR